jgi:signal transduction histidine kinase/DNA-binding response OmpR family regulator
MQGNKDDERTRARARILLVDDRPENLLALEALLGPLGHDLVRARSGAEALDALGGDEFALILLDIRMPGMDGLETAARLRGLSAGRTPIIFVTADGATPYSRRAYELGAADILVKPIDPQALLAKVGVFIELFKRGQRIRQEDAERVTREERLRALEAQPPLTHPEELERLRLENAWLRDARDRRDALIAIAPAFFGFLSPDGFTTDVNDLALQVIEATRDRIIGKLFWEGPWWASISQSAARIREAIAEASAGRASQFDIEYCGYQGGVAQTRWVAFGLVPIRDVHGKVFRLAATGMDITDRIHSSNLLALEAETRRRAEAQEQRARRDAESARAELHSLFMQAPAPLCVLRGPAHTFALANPAYMHLVGAGRKLVGLTVREAVPEVEGQGFIELLDRVYASGERVVGNDVPINFDRRADGTLDDAFVSFVYEPYRDLDGVVAGILVIAFDVTDTVRARQTIEATLEEREQLLAITEDARRKAESANRAKDEFLAVASHELRTPLNSILGWARILRGQSLDAAGFLRGLETIERNAKAQVQLIEDILDSSRIIAGKLHLEVRSLDLTAVVRAALDAVRPAAAAKDIAITVTLDPAAAHIRGDTDRLQQVVWNLVNNAIKFTPRKGNVEIRLERIGSSVELSIKDDGQGIAPELLPHLFERFRQGDASTTRRHGGLGLGLALVRHLVEAHGGAVRAESEGEGRGATFAVALPVQAVFPEVTAISRPHVTGEGARAATTPASLDGISVLVVDDEPDARDLVATVLRIHGAAVTLAESAEEALELLDVATHMVLVSDIGMPVTDGYSLIRRVRALDTATAKIPALALTAYAREEDRRRALEAGFHAYLAKPVDPQVLVRMVLERARPS